jgi:hypothetical protein
MGASKSTLDWYQSSTSTVKAHIGPDRFGSLAGHGSIEMPE